MEDNSPRRSQNQQFYHFNLPKSPRLPSLEVDLANVNDTINNTYQTNINEIDQNFKFVLFYTILFVIIFISNLIYFNAPSHRLDNYIDDISQIVNGANLTSPFSLYKVISRFSDNNKIFIELKLITPYNKTDSDNNFYFEKLFVSFIFAINKINVKIFSSNKEEFDNFPKNLYESNDFDLEDHKISDIEESNLGVMIINYPFNFMIYRKDMQSNEIVFDTRNYNENQFLYTKNYKQIYTKLPEGHYSFGLGEEFSNMRLENERKYFVFANNSLNTDEFILNKKQNKNGISSIPIQININPKTLNPNGVVFLNTGPVEVELNEDSVLFKIFSGSINFYIFNGNSPKEVIEEYQKTLGIPLLPSFESIEWQEYLLLNYQDDLGNKINNSSLKKIHLDIKNSQNISTSIKFDNFSDHTFYPYFKSTNEGNEINASEIESKIKNCSEINKFDVNVITLNTQFINNSNNLNNYLSLFEAKTYYNILKDMNISRPLIFSLSNFLGSSQYSGKWLGYVHPSFEGMKQALLHTMKYSIYGNPHTIHEACGNINSENVTGKTKIKNYIELCLKWIQMVSVFPHARINNFSYLIENLQKSSSPSDIINLNTSLKLRYSLSLYIYSYFLKMSLEGGSIIRPLILDFASKQHMTELIELETQFMVGSNLMVNPIFDYSTNNNNYKSTFFPSVKFYDFYSGELLNAKGPGFYNLTIIDSKLSIYVRGGLITPIQIIPEDIFDFKTMKNFNFNEIKKLPIKLIVALDMNFRATGRILLDDTNNNDFLTKRFYYKMEMTASYSNNNFIMLFHVNSYKYKLPVLEYPFINQIEIYGFSKISVKRVTIINKISKVEVPRDKFYYDDMRDILKISGIEITMDSDTKVVIT